MVVGSVVFGEQAAINLPAGRYGVADLLLQRMECALTAPQRKRCGSYRTVRRAAEEGASPSLGVLRSVREHNTIPGHIRLSSSRRVFYYTDGEFAAMLEDIRLVQRLGFPGWLLAC